MNKNKNTQDQINKVLVSKIYECVLSISERQEKKGIPITGLTLVVGEIGVDGRKYDMTLCLTPDGVLDSFQNQS